MQMDKKSKKVLKALARKLTEDDRPIKSKDLKKTFSRAVTGLPECTLQKVLQDNFTECLEFLKTRIKKLQDKLEVVLSIKKEKEDTGDEVQEEEEEEEEIVDNKYFITDNEHKFPYNFYLTERSNVLKNPDSQDNQVENQFFLLKIQQEDNQNAVIKLVKEFQRVTQEKSIMTALDQLLVLSTGIKDIKLVKKLLSVYLRKMQPLTEKYLEEENTKKISIVHENLHKLLYVSHMRYHSIKSEVKEEKPCYKDLVASLLSVYLDLSVFLFRNEEIKIKLSRLLYGFISFMTTDFPDQRYDVLLQLTQMQDDQVQLIFPLIQYCIEKTPNDKDSQSYIKYIVSVGLVSRLSQQAQLTFQHGIKRARTIVPPPGTERWLAEHIPELTDVDEELDNLSTYLLDNMTDSLQSKLIDSLCDDEGIRDDEDEDIKEEEDEGEQKMEEDEILVFNPDLSDRNFFGSPDSAQMSSGDDDMGDIFMVDRKGKNDKKKNQIVKTEEDDIAAEDKDEVDFGNLMSLNKTDFVSPTKFAYSGKKTLQSPAIKSSPRMIAIVSPNRQIKQEAASEEEDKAISSDDFRKTKKHITASPDKSTGVQSPKKTTNDASVISPKLRSTAKYISASPSRSNVISPSNLLDELSPKSKSPTKSQKLKSPDHSGIKSPSQSEVKSPTPANVKPAKLNSPVQQEVQSPGIKSPKMKPPNQPEIGLPKFKSPSQSEIRSPKMKSPSQPEIGSPKIKSPSQPEIGSPKMKSPSQREIKSEIGSPKMKLPNQSEMKSPKIKSPSQPEIGSPKMKLQIGSPKIKSEIGSPKIKSPSQPEIGSPKMKSEIGSPKIKSPSQPEIGSPKMKLQIGSPKNKSPSQPENGSPKIKSEIGSPKIKSPSQHAIGSPKMKSPSQPGIGSPKIKSPRQHEIKSPKIKSPVRKIQSPKLKSDVMSETKESDLSPKLKSPKTMSPTRLTSPLRQVTQQSPTVLQDPFIDHKVIDLSSESSMEASKSPSLRKGSRTRKPSRKAENSVRSPSSGDQDSDVQFISALDTRKMNTSIKEYTIISDSEGTDVEPMLRSSRKRISEIPDLAVHLNKSRRTSSSESDTHSKSKRRSRTSESSSENTQFTSLMSPRPVKNSRRGSNDALNNEELSGKQMLGILEVVKEDEEMITGHKTTAAKLRSPIGLRKRSISESQISEIRTPSKRSSRRSVSDNETSVRTKTPRSIETRMRTRRTSTGSMSDDETQKLPLGRETSQHIPSHQTVKLEKIEESDLETTTEKSSPKKRKSLSPRSDGTTSRLSLKKKSPSQRYSLRTR